MAQPTDQWHGMTPARFRVNRGIGPPRHRGGPTRSPVLAQASRAASLEAFTATPIKGTGQPGRTLAGSSFRIEEEGRRTSVPGRSAWLGETVIQASNTSTSVFSPTGVFYPFFPISQTETGKLCPAR